MVVKTWGSGSSAAAFSLAGGGGSGDSCAKAGAAASVNSKKKRLPYIAWPPTIHSAIDAYLSKIYMPTKYITPIKTESIPKWNNRRLVR